MSESKISELTTEQQALIPKYREKWIKIALSTERIDREKAAEAVELLYYLKCKDKPKILFYESPYQALNQFCNEKFVEYTGYLFNLRSQLKDSIGSSLWYTLWEELNDKTISELGFISLCNLYSQLEKDIGE